MQPNVAVVALRLPIRVRRGEDGARVVPSVGGVATGLQWAIPRARRQWIGWPGSLDGLDDATVAQVEAELGRRRLHPVLLQAEEAATFYAGYANRVLWPAFHSMPGMLPLRIDSWPAYRAANAAFARAAIRVAGPEDILWVHDYQVMLVPELVRTARPAARIAFFLHIPFPPNDVYRVLPQARELLTGVLGADQVAFHTAEYRANFAQAVQSLLGVRVTSAGDAVRVGGRTVRLEVAPMGIAAERFERMAMRAGTNGALEDVAGQGEALVLLGVDRLDYTKGIPRRLLAFESLLRRYPQWREHVVFVQVAVPSRSDVAEYRASASETAQLVGRINGEFSTPRWTPIHYLSRSLSQAALAALYRTARAAVVTPIRDGMNLVAKEFVACRVDGDGVLVLSEFAGAATELVEALIVNPYDIEGTADQLHTALSMSAGERRARMQSLRRRVRQEDVRRWARRLLAAIPARRGTAAPRRQSLADVVREVRRAPHLLLLLDYDGTLVPFVVPPEAALPARRITTLLRRLAARARTTTCILSGRDRGFLERAVGATGVGLVAEHGAWWRPPGQSRWRQPLAAAKRRPRWRRDAIQIMRDFEESTPGSRIERKALALVWHWRGVSPAIGLRRSEDLALRLRSKLPPSADILTGNHIIEVRPRGVDKGSILPVIRTRVPDETVIVAVGDDATDEDLFRRLDESAISIHVGTRPSAARFRVEAIEEVVTLLEGLVRA